MAFGLILMQEAGHSHKVIVFCTCVNHNIARQENSTALTTKLLGFQSRNSGGEVCFESESCELLITLPFSYVASKQLLELVSQLLWLQVLPVVETSNQYRTASRAST